MKKKILLICLMVSLFVVVFALSASAATTNEFSSTVETIDGINLEGMSTDTTSRVVLYDGNEYHTYPSCYIVTNNASFTYDFTRIGGSYSVSSVIRIEIPTTVTAIPGDGSSNPLTRYNVVEVYFPENSTITAFSYGCFANSKTLKKVNVPKSVTSLNTYTFYKSTALEEIVFHKESSIESIPAYTFKGCKSIKSLTLPNSIKTIANASLDFEQNCVISELRLGDGLIDFGSMHFDWVQYKDKIFKIYAPDTFLANIDSIDAPIYTKQGTFTSYGSSLYSVCIYFCGDKDQLDALIAKSEYDKFTNANLVEWDPTKSDDEYGALNTWTIVYNYSECKAFYDDEHLEDTNPCLIECTRCDMAELDPNGQHSFTDKITYADYYSNGTLARTCATENCPYHTSPLVDNSIAPLFTYLGFSSNGVDITVGYTVNLDAYDAFVSCGNALASFGVVGYIPSNENPNPLKAGANGVELAEPEYTIHANVPAIHSGFDFIIRGLSTDAKVSLVMCAYIYDGSKITYLGNGAQAENATTITVLNGQLVAE